MTSTKPDWFIGTDIVSVLRISNLLQKESDSFTSRVFTETEIAYCIDRKNPSIHFAGRFAAKEALKKAILSQNPDAIIPLKSLSIERLESGEPTVEYDAPLDCKVSISHTEEFAIAFALVRPKQ